jgi:hypothetical protein
LRLFIISHVQTQSNRVCNSYVILLWLILPRAHFVSRFLYFTTAGVKCRVAAVQSIPVLHFSVVIFFWSFGIINASAIECWELGTAQAGARGVWDVALVHYSSCADSIKPNCNSYVILLWLMLPRDHFVYTCLKLMVFTLKNQYSFSFSNKWSKERDVFFFPNVWVWFYGWKKNNDKFETQFLILLSY